MLEAIQPLGTRPPLFIVHGMYGIMSIGTQLVTTLGLDQPFYGIRARGFDGAEKACETVKAMAAAYLPVIRKVCPTGPYLIAGMCHGGFAAIEIARELLVLNQQVAPVLLLDPGLAPHRNAAGMKKLESALAQPSVMRQLHDQALYAVRTHAQYALNPPFDLGDPIQTQRAVEVGITTSLAFARHRVAPFYGATEMILSSDWARNFFDPNHEWQTVLPAKRTFHILQGVHTDLFDVHLAKVCQLVRIYVESALDGEAGRGAPELRYAEPAVEGILTETK